jgi:hypothetical protein
MSEFENLFRPRSLRASEHGTSTSDEAVRWNLVGALIFGLIWWIPSDWSYLHGFFERGLVYSSFGALSIFLIVLVVGSMWFFLIDMFCAMAGGGMSSFRIAVGAAALVATAFCERVAIVFVRIDLIALAP